MPRETGCYHCDHGRLRCVCPEDRDGVARAQAQASVDQEPFKAEAARGQDNVNLPAHYARFKIEPIHFICANGLNFFQGNIVKYILRHDAKNGLEDLRKARRYLDMFIKFQEGDPDWWKVAA